MGSRRLALVVSPEAGLAWCPLMIRLTCLLLTLLTGCRDAPPGETRNAPPAALPSAIREVAATREVAASARAPSSEAVAGPKAQSFTLTWSAPEPQLRAGEIARPETGGRLNLALPAPEQAQPDGEAGGGSEAALPGPWRSRLDALYGQLEKRRPREVRFLRGGGGWVAQAQTGWVVDRAATEAALRRALREGRASSAVVLKLAAPDRSVRWAQAQGLRHLATGETSFAGSPEFRVHNIVTGAGRVGGVWLAPGETFNFNRLIGPVSARRGFKPGYVISGGGLATEDGGGICQVSTTVFRAALRAGLPITERHAHSRQVAYYGEPGLDAAVYAPAKNLRFVNDTGGPLLVQAEWDTDAERLQIHLFGRSSGRQVTVGEPVQTRLRPAGEPQFMTDPALAQGEVRRIDMPAPGAQVSVLREIRGARGELLLRENWRSSYRPWGGAFAVAPGDPRARD